jgi:trigger factor
MKVEVQELSPIEKKLSIEVESGRVADELTRAYATLGKQVKIAGFRPGKVPRRILEQRFKDQVEDDVAQRVVERAYLEAIREHKVDVVSSPTVTKPALKLNEPFTFEARVEVKPKLEPKDYQEISLKKTDTVVDDAKIQEQLERMRQSFGRLEPVEGRDIAQANDYAQVDYEATIDGKPFTGNKAEGIAVQVAPGELVESKMAALEGVKVGESKDIDYAFPPDYGNDEVKGKTARFRVTLKGLKREVTPEINDDFAKEVQGGNTLEELKTKIRGDLEKSAKVKADQEEREQLIAQLVEKNPFEVPKAMVERATDLMLDNALRAMARSGIDVRQMNLDFNRLREEMQPRALTEVRGTLLLEAIAQKENIHPSDDDLEKRLETLAEEAGQPLSQVKKIFKSSEDRQGLFLRLREEKTVEFLKARAKYS